MSKKYIAALGLGVLLLTACQPAVQIATETTQEVQLSNAEILNKIQEVQKATTSQSIDIQSDVVMSKGKTKQTLSARIEHSYTTSPVALKNKTTTTMFGQVTEGTVYLVDDYVYMKSSLTDNTWRKVTPSQAGLDMTQLTNTQAISDLNTVSPDDPKLSITTENGKYVLTYNDLEGERFKNALSNLKGMENLARLNMQVYNIKTKIVYDKKTFILESFEVTADMKSDKMTDVTMALSQKGIVSNYNSVPTIEVPQEAK